MNIYFSWWIHICAWFCSNQKASSKCAIKVKTNNEKRKKRERTICTMLLMDSEPFTWIETIHSEHIKFLFELFFFLLFPDVCEHEHVCALLKRKRKLIYKRCADSEISFDTIVWIKCVCSAVLVAIFNVYIHYSKMKFLIEQTHWSLSKIFFFFSFSDAK